VARSEPALRNGVQAPNACAPSVNVIHLRAVRRDSADDCSFVIPSTDHSQPERKSIADR
jgi:hypothetical protein